MGRAVLFDLVGTLVRPRGSIGEQYARYAEAFGARPDPSRLDSAFKRAMKAAPPLAFPGRPFEEAAALERRWWVGVVGAVVREAGLADELAGETFDRFFDALYDHFATTGAWELFPDAEPALSRLKSMGCRLGLVTNYDTRVFGVLDAMGLARYFDAVSIPAHVGAAKPDAAIFAHALSQLRASAADTLHVGDEMDDDYEGAVAAGIEAVLLDRENAFAARRDVRRIDTLAALYSPEMGSGRSFLGRLVE